MRVLFISEWYTLSLITWRSLDNQNLWVFIHLTNVIEGLMSKDKQKPSSWPKFVGEKLTFTYYSERSTIINNKVCKYFLSSHWLSFCCWLFPLLWRTFLCGFMWSGSTLSIFTFVVFAFGVVAKKSLPRPMSRFPPIFSIRSFTISGLMFKSLIHFYFIFMYNLS